MASITATNIAKLSPGTGPVLKGLSGFHSCPVLAEISCFIVIVVDCLTRLPRMVTREGVRCSMVENKSSASGEGSISNTSMSALLMAAALVVIASTTGPAMPLVDERLSTEGTGLPFGLSNNLLGWIIFGMFGLTWAFYFIYTSNLEEDEESGLSL